MCKLCFCVAKYQYEYGENTNMGVCCYEHGTLVRHWQSDTPTDTQYLPYVFPFWKYKTFCSHFVTMVLRRSCPPSQCLPSLVKYGWEFSNALLVPLITYSSQGVFGSSRNEFLGL